MAVPVGVEDGSSVPTEKGDDVGEFASFIERYNGEGTTSRGIPID